GRMIVTWDRVSYYKCHDDLDQRMSFQLILTEVASGTCGALGDFDVEFRYNRCEWNAGDASGGRAGLATATGIPAQAGFDAGNLMDFVMIPGSRTPEIHTLLCAGSNVGDVATNPELAGIWRFEIRAGVVVCPGAGAPCDTGSAGVCAPGRMQCVADRVECRPELGASAEVCDSLDNDCNGMVDDGDLCGPMEICSAGVCVGNCFEGGCFAGFSCGADGYCVEDACLGVSCALGERCEGGACVSPCEGIVCPSGQECRAGVCVDLCLEAVCDDCTVCVGGACLTRCQLEPCAAGMSCRVDGRCVEDACAALSCAVGEVCQAGACVDACLGAICPAGEICSMGACGAAPPDAGVPDAGVTDAGTVDAGVPDGAVTPIDASAADATAGGDASGDGGPVSGTPDAGCACTLAGASSPSGLPAGLLSLGLGLLLTIRRRRS
ncbi:MAG: MYXO-CTERM sorting domain-containing protein, partial [Myxococcales bacterium]|nr:MYXO-CTERM sorting domain-containing protein [Myxococcales bacterium]